MNTFYMVKGAGPAHVKHRSFRSAEDEAQRLARQHPGQEFFVLKAVTCFRKLDVERIEMEPEEVPMSLRDFEIPF